MEAFLFITDKSGERSWNTSVGLGFHSGELRNLKHRLTLVKAGKVNGIDPQTARIVMIADGKELNPETLTPSLAGSMTQADADLLTELGL